eukprot:s4373_g8.t1
MLHLQNRSLIFDARSLQNLFPCHLAECVHDESTENNMNETVHVDLVDAHAARKKQLRYESLKPLRAMHRKFSATLCNMLSETF